MYLDFGMEAYLLILLMGLTYQDRNKHDSPYFYVYVVINILVFHTGQM